MDGGIHMQKRYRVLTINPKSTTTIISVFHDEMCMYKLSIQHDDVYRNEIATEVKNRKQKILSHLMDAGINISKLNAVAAVGGLLRPVKGGTYIVTDDVLSDLKIRYNGEHASNLGGIIAYEIAIGLNIPAYIVDPPVVDELSSIAKYSGLPGYERKSIFHALNQKAVARQVAYELDQAYEQVNLIVAHLGNGITIGAHNHGKVVDVNNGLHGDGPFSFERTGTIPSESLIDLCFSEKYSKEEVIHMITTQGGLKAYLQTNTIEATYQKLNSEDDYAQTICEALVFQIAKEIGSMGAVLSGNVDGVVLTGQLASSSKLTNQITERINWIADVFIYPGEYDLQALNAGTLRVLRGEEMPKVYSRELDEEVI